MSVSNLASSVRRPLTAATFDFTSQSRGGGAVERNLLLVGMQTSAATATANEPVEVFDEDDAVTKFGGSSELALGVQWALRNARRVKRQIGGSQPTIYCVPLADPAGTAAVHRFAVSGTATESGDLVVRVCGRTYNVPVSSGDTNTTVATAIETQLDGDLQNLPVTVAVTVANCDLTAVHTGVFGNDIDITVVKAPAGITVTASQPTTGVGTAAMTTALANSLTRQYLAIACGNHASADVTAMGTHMTSAWDSSQKMFGHGFFAEIGSVGTATTLAGGANDETIAVVAYTGCPNLPIEIAAAVATMSLMQEKPSYNYDLTELDLYAPYSAADNYIASEIESALAGGATPISVNEAGKSVMQRLVTTKTTVSSATFEDLLDLKNSKTLAHYALIVDASARRAMKGANLDDEFVNLIKDLVFDILKQGEEAGDLHNVDDHKEEIVASVHPSIKSRLLCTVPQSVVQSAHQIDFTHRMFIEAPL